MAIRIDEGPLTDRAVNGPALYYTTAVPEAAPVAGLGLLHGYADHGARYHHVIGALAEMGIAVVALDMRGHGRAAGRRGYCERFSEYMDDVAELPPLLHRVAKDVPHFLFGHSFGGLVAAQAQLQPNKHAWKGLVLSAPFVRLAMAVPKVKLWAGELASKVLPTLGLPSGLHGADLTHDAERARGYDADPLVFPKATARWFTETKRAQEHLFAHASKIELPLYMAFGDADRVASFEGGRELFQKVGSKDKTFVPYPGLFHEILNEPSWKEIAEGMAKFVLDHAKK